MGTLLCVGVYPYDVVQILTVARQAGSRLGLEPVFLDVADLAPPEVSAEARELVSAAGFRTVTAPLIGSAGGANNKVDRLRRLREATLQNMDDLLDDLQPAAILAGVNPPPGFFLDHAVARGIPAVFVQLFHWGDRALYRGLHRDDRRHEDVGLSLRGRVRRVVARRLQAHYGFAPYIAWKVRLATVAVQGPAMRRRLIAGGVPRDNVIVTGNPVLDELYALRTPTSIQEARGRIRRQLGLSNDTRIVTQMRSHEARLVGVTSTALRDSQATIIASLRSAAPDAQVIVKIHPKENDADRAFVRSIDPSVLVVGQEVATNDLLAASDVVLGAGSTTMLYAVLLDRPTVSIWLWPGADYFRTSTEWSGVERVESPEALTQAVRSHLEDPQHREAWQQRREAFIAEEFAYDGRSTERIIELLDRLTATPSSIASARIG